jgi:hypothetical protein
VGPRSSWIRSLLIGIALVVSCAGRLSAQGLPLTMQKAFTPSSVVVSGTSTTTMTVTITNPNAFSVSGISFSDTYPAGLVPDQVGAYTCAAGSALFNGTGWSLTNVTLGAGASCSVPILMHATITGDIVNTTSQVTGTGVPSGGPASATLTVSPSVPALSPWMLAGLGLLLAGLAAARIGNLGAGSAG